MKKNILWIKALLLIILLIGAVTTAVPTANKMLAAYKLNRYFDRVGIEESGIESIEYYSSPAFSVGLPDKGAYVEYKNEPGYVYLYSYCMTGNSIYPDISVTCNGKEVNPKEYDKLKNYTISYEEYIAESE